MNYPLHVTVCVELNAKLIYVAPAVAFKFEFKVLHVVLPRKASRQCSTRKCIFYPQASRHEPFQCVEYVERGRLAGPVVAEHHVQPAELYFKVDQAPVIMCVQAG